MKRFVALVSCLACVLCASARSDSVSVVYDVVAIVFFVFAFLQILLFFRVWRMTSDVRSMLFKITEKEAYARSKERYNRTCLYRRASLLGDTDAVKRCLLDNFIDSVELKYNSLPQFVWQDEDRVDMREQNQSVSIEDEVSALVSEWRIVGEDLPAGIAELRTYRDYLTLFRR